VMGLSSALKFFHVVLDLASSKSVSLLALATCLATFRPVAGLAQVQEPGCAGGET